ncbi:phosphoglycolate phosphatase-like HAD superfamily hydrolase [Haloactinospora alba]|uniref:Phosphoglycolate phosphatase-like HAD superfamily hydrolase n=1 Tax=Haloactinospora alba TaxID=405555 RepID=A0A543NJQ3_9ACTN|nr:HAD family hydrolase [Haloactinospora alba]TQN32049.1 phosphoglycolate phosphatase-like HAD superfamily hydrolase [Haloactinospora alba]
MHDTPRTHHIVWDWNGTLFADAPVLIESTIEAFAALGMPPVTADLYRRVHTQPIPVFYERLAGRALSESEHASLAEAFHTAYLRRRSSLTLDEGAHHALEQTARAGLSQSLLSMYPHHRLLPLVRDFGIEPHFTRVEGQRGTNTEGKRQSLREHLRTIGVDGSRCLVIGDSVDDARAAAHVGARCVLYASGLHTAQDLARTGAPVVESLDEALTTARVPQQEAS